MIEYSLYFGLGYFIAYFLLMKLCKSWIFFEYINEKTIRGYISVFVLLIIFVLTIGAFDSLIKSNNIENIFVGLMIGALAALLRGIKIPKVNN